MEKLCQKVLVPLIFPVLAAVVGRIPWHFGTAPDRVHQPNNVGQQVGGGHAPFPLLRGDTITGSAMNAGTQAGRIQRLETLRQQP